MWAKTKEGEAWLLSVRSFRIGPLIIDFEDFIPR